MTMTQTVEIPTNRRLIIDVPSQIPTGPVVLAFTPKTVVQEQKKDRIPGCVKGQIWMSDDFDEPLEDFKDYM